MKKERRFYRAATIRKYFVDGKGNRSEWESYVISGSMKMLEARLKKLYEESNEWYGIISHEIHEESYTAQEAKWLKLEA